MKTPESHLYRTQQSHEHLGTGAVQLEAGPRTAPATHETMASVTSLSPLSFLLQSNTQPSEVFYTFVLLHLTPSSTLWPL